MRHKHTNNIILFTMKWKVFISRKFMCVCFYFFIFTTCSRTLSEIPFDVGMSSTYTQLLYCCHSLLHTATHTHTNTHMGTIYARAYTHYSFFILFIYYYVGTIRFFLCCCVSSEIGVRAGVALSIILCNLIMVRTTHNVCSSFTYTFTRFTRVLSSLFIVFSNNLII